ncbi:MAG TPA: TIGR00730 family Rossman fold protein [Bacteroidales bacterium]|nr:TIGR00730 family Rossman fold protein [Bacteroidales bacterium]HSA42221.1 TIGR00730 family Rossman fold protein [Bacteroidales bacterium]
MESVCVFCGSSSGVSPVYRDAARSLGHYLAKEGIRLVYGGASVGLMGELADAALESGAQITGVIPSFFSRKEIAHKGLTELHFVDSMHERKLKMAALSGGFIALPGGYGTMDEFFEMLTWTQLDLHQKPVGLLNTNGYFDLLIRFFDHMTGEGFVRDAHRQALLCADNAEELLEMMNKYQPLRLEKWLKRIKET